MAQLTYGMFISQIFPGNYDRHIVVTHRFIRPLAGRYFKVHPVTWRSWISMRVEFYGCVIGMYTYFLLFSNY